jgi:2,3-bisphosphoglycerate-dependent phosphoglycerate mutase
MEEDKRSGILVLVRHGESLWNARHIWTGLTDIGLSEKGKQEAVRAAGRLTDIHFDRAFTSTLCRASDSLRIILEKLSLSSLPVIVDAALNERDYGIYTGKNKLEIQASLGENAYHDLRRGWDCPIPQGESLKQVYGRVVPYYEHTILPLLVAGQHVLLVAHGNSLRALIKKIDNISDADIPRFEIATGDIIIYHIDPSGRVQSKEVRAVSSLE